MSHAVAFSSIRLSGTVVVLIAFGILLLGATGALWAYFGTAVFFEMVAAGLAYCF